MLIYYWYVGILGNRHSGISNNEYGPQAHNQLFEIRLAKKTMEFMNYD